MYIWWIVVRSNTFTKYFEPKNHTVVVLPSYPPWSRVRETVFSSWTLISVCFYSSNLEFLPLLGLPGRTKWPNLFLNVFSLSEWSRRNVVREGVQPFHGVSPYLGIPGTKGVTFFSWPFHLWVEGIVRLYEVSLELRDSGLSLTFCILLHLPF